MSEDPFDLDKYKLSPEQVAALAPFQKKSKSRARPAARTRRSAASRFVLLPYVPAAAGRLRNPQLAVLLEVAYLDFKSHGKLTPLANKALRVAGVTRWAKLRALHQLEAAGLVEVIWQSGKKSPLVTLRWN